MLSILYFVISAVITGVISYYIIEFLMMMYIESRICKFSLGVAQDYLMENGRGYFQDKTIESVIMEAQIRTFLIMGLYAGLIILVIILFPSDLSFWIVPRWAIKAGLLGGVLINGLFSAIVSVTTRACVGRLESINDKGVANFKGLWGDDFTFDVGKYWDREDWPPEGWRFMVLKFILFGGLAPLELNSDKM